MTNAYVIMESASDPVKVNNVEVQKDNSQVSFVRFDTTLQTLGDVNRNKRKYLPSAVVPSLKAPHILELQSKKSWCGEAGHPLSNDKARILTIDPKSISHRITKTSVQGNKIVKGTIETISGTEFGKSMTSAILQGVEPAFSLRAISRLSVDKDGTSVAATPIHIVTYDWVFFPSHKTAYIDDIRNVECIVNNIDSNKIVQEGFIANVDNDDILSYLKDQSNNYKIISSVTEATGVNVEMVGDNMSVVMENALGDSIIVPIEKKITLDIRSYLSNL